LSLNPGDRLGPYVIAELLGAGGMGEVWRAHDTRLGRDVAVKVLPAALEGDPDRLKRLEREARATAQLHHPAIVSVFDVGEQDGRPYVVMELLEGETLRSLLRHGPPPRTQALALARDVLDGLGAAHARGTLHRDLKPENVFVTVSGRAKILDFGLAKLRASLAGPPDADAVTLSAPESLTEDGTVFGTAGYLSPEQVRGLPLDSRSDLFAFGCVLHELLTGRRAFEGPTAADRLGALLRDEPEALRVPGLLDERLRSVLARCLAKDPRDRFGSAAEVARALADDAVSATPAAAPPGERRSSPSRSRRRAVLLAGTIVLVAASGAVVTVLRARPAGIDSVAVLPLASDAGDGDLAFLADGLSEGLINRLSRVPGLRVVARTTAFRYRGRENDAVVAGRELGVRAVLSGRVARRADTIAVQADLVDVASGAQIWGDRFTRAAATVASTSEELAGLVADRLRPRLAEADRERVARPSTRNADAYRLYVAGRFYWDKRDPANMQRALESFRQAIDADPTFALAWSGLADVFVFPYSGERRAETIPRAREAATRALQLDPDLAEAHATLGFVRMNWDFDWSGALAQLDRAIALSPSYPVAHQFRGGGLLFRGRTDEGLESARRALSLDRLSLAQNWYVGFLLYLARRPAEALEQCRAALRLVPNAHLGHSCVGNALLALGRPAEALPEFLEARKLREDPLDATAEIVRALVALGRRSEALAAARDLEAAALREPERSYATALALEAVGEREKALTFLEASRAGHSFGTFFSGVDPALDTLRNEPRFRTYLASIGLEDADASIRRP
jgi:eukaryotic-like serine/threonine-protein kinase